MKEKKNTEKKEPEVKAAEKVEPTAEQPKEQKQENAPKAEPAEDETAKLKAQLAETSDKYVRLVAEFDNYRRRTAKERLELIETADKDVLTGFLPIMDDCERALEVLRRSDAGAAAIEGTELILNKISGYLKSKGVTKIEAVGKDFDTDFHEAVAQFPAQDPSQKNKVIDVTENGYLLHGKVMRFAKVVVGI